MSKVNIVRVVKTIYDSYSLHFTNPDGRRRRISVGSDYNQAQRLSFKFSDWLIDGKNPETELQKAIQTEKSKSITLKEIFPLFMERHGSLQSKNMQQFYVYRFKHILRCPALCDIPIGNITKNLVINYMHTRIKQDGVTSSTANREANVMKGILSRAVEWDFLERNPLSGLKMLPESEKRQVKLDYQKAMELISELPKSFSSIVEFALFTGFRKENILELRIEQIRFHDLTNTGEAELVVKGGRTELFPLCPAAVEVLKRNIGTRLTGYVFINQKTGTRFMNINRSFDRRVRKLGLTVNDTKLRFHDLRHVFATWLHQAGVSLDIIRPLLGHKDRETTDRYVTYDKLNYAKMLDSIPNFSKKIV